MEITHVEGYGDGDLGLILEGVSSEITEIVIKLQGMIATIFPGVVEVVWKKQNIAGYGIGPKKMSEQFCYIAIYKNHINLGFYNGVDLNDPKDILEGSGKRLRHIKIKSIDHVDRAVEQLIRESISDIKQRIGK